MTLATAVVLAMSFAGCGHPPAAGRGEPTATESRTSRPEQESPQTESTAEAASQHVEDEIIEGRIVSTSPLGHGDCTQRSYQVEPVEDGVERLWLHWERCGSEDGPSYEGLDVGRSYRFTVDRGASENFADDPMIVSVEPL